jgi:hypothetical protein
MPKSKPAKGTKATKAKGVNATKAASDALTAAATPPSSPGAVWSNNNKACNKTWWWLAFLNQIDKAFPAAENIKMSELTFWNETSSAEAREIEAEGLADMVIKGFRLDGAVYEPDYNYASALLAMTKTLTDANKTVSQFAAVNDELFLFFKEEKLIDLN